MTPFQRQLIKEAYEEGYKEALHENKFINAIRRLLGLPVKVDPPAPSIRRRRSPISQNPEPSTPTSEPNPINPDDPFGRGSTRLSAAEDRYLQNLQDRVSDLEDEIVDQMGNDGREIIDNMNTFGKNLPVDQKINYYRDILRREAEDLPDINNPLDDMP